MESFCSLSESPGLERVVCADPLLKSSLASSVLDRVLGSTPALGLVGGGAVASSRAACQMPAVGFSNFSNFFLMFDTLLDKMLGAVLGLDVSGPRSLNSSGERSFNSVVGGILASPVIGLLIIKRVGVGIGTSLAILDVEAFLDTVAMLDTDAFLDIGATEGLLASFDVEEIEGLLDLLEVEDVLELEDAGGLLASIDASEGLFDDSEGLLESIDDTLMAFVDIPSALTPATVAE